ncbi:TRAP transporter permease [Natrarchaeobius chitinivorans]|uniref:TRAP transporter fused permease subunit n=1 Tax=Natrarchaeobius chitinivorans TaxID=1679083 RepID=A0A3N6NA34_NATCH|nr:TRAP transporter fused permease subunit [Natrarchaeobius chitinivorans]RQG95442.1 TRAP transporter fused permease subunit [Natrarchaeobius chitinivorans]
MNTVEKEYVDQESDRYSPSLETLTDKLIFAVGVFTGTLCIYFLYTRPVTEVEYTNAYIGLMFVLYFLLEAYRVPSVDNWSYKTWAKNVVFVVAMIAGIAGILYVQVMYDALAYERFAIYTTADTLAGAGILFATVVATHRAFGNIITGVVLFVIFFTVYGQYFPGILNHSGDSWTNWVSMTTLEFTGVYHMISQIGGTWIFIFLLWAGLIEELDFLEVLFDIGFLFGSLVKSGVAQTAVVASMLMGSITGSPMANIAVTGSFTIPLMKERGLSGRLAGAIESCASTGGMVLPPIMGSVAFIMANFLGIPYADIIIAAAIPALLFYGAIMVSVHLIVTNYPSDLNVDREIDRNTIIKKGTPMALSLIALIYMLVELRYPPGISGVYAIAILGISQLGVLAVVSDDIVAQFKQFAVQVIRGLVTGSVRMAPLTIILAGMGIVITSFNYTGMGYRISLSIVSLAAGSVILLLVLVMISAIVLGMGMPTVAAYLVTVTLIAPAMVEVGFAEITAHFYVFYFAMLATVTPPIALGPAIASQIAEADFIQTALTAAKISIPLFLLPYIFAFNEELLLIDGWNTAITFVQTMIGFVIICYVLFSSFSRWDRPARIGIRSTLFGTAFLILFSSQIIALIA